MSGEGCMRNCLDTASDPNILKEMALVILNRPYTAIENLSLIWNISAFVKYFFKNPKKLQPNALPYTLHFLTFTRLQPCMNSIIFEVLLINEDVRSISITFWVVLRKTS